MKHSIAPLKREIGVEPNGDPIETDERLRATSSPVGIVGRDVANTARSRHVVERLSAGGFG
jgi:hypothetical protein